MEELVRAYLTAALTLLALALLALPFLERSSPSFAVDVTAIILLLAFIALLLAYGRRVVASGYTPD